MTSTASPPPHPLPGATAAVTWALLSAGVLAGCSLLAFGGVAWHVPLLAAAVIGVLSGAFLLANEGLRRPEAALLVVVTFIAVSPQLGAVALPLLLTAGALGLWRHAGLRRNIPAPSLLAFTAVVLVVLGTRFYADFQLDARLAALQQHRDTAFHATIAAFLRDYNVASIGFDGLAPLAYHTLSHRVLGGLSHLTGLPTLQAYSYLYIVLGPTLLVVSLALLLRRIRPATSLSEAILVIALLFAAIRYGWAFKRAGLWDNYFLSESFLLALVLLAAAITAFLDYLEDRARWQLLALSLLLTIAAGLSKGSVGLVGICMYGIPLLRRHIDWRYLLLMLAGAAGMYFAVIDMASAARERLPVVPLDFVIEFVKGPGGTDSLAVRTAWHLAVFFLPVWLCAWFGLRAEGRAWLRSTECLLLAALLLPGLVLSLSFDIAGGSAAYFSAIAPIVALPFLAARLLAIRRIDNPGWKPLLVIGGILLAFCARGMHGKSLVADADGERVPVAGVSAMVDTMLDWRDTLPHGVAMRVADTDRWIAITGCDGYWLLTALAERPVIRGYPNPALCRQTTLLGLDDYTPAGPRTPPAVVLPVVDVRFAD